MKKEIAKKILEYAEKQYLKEKDKWLSGFKNKFFAWEDAVNELRKELGL